MAQVSPRGTRDRPVSSSAARLGLPRLHPRSPRLRPTRKGHESVHRGARKARHAPEALRWLHTTTRQCLSAREHHHLGRRVTYTATCEYHRFHDRAGFGLKVQLDRHEFSPVSTSSDNPKVCDQKGAPETPWRAARPPCQPWRPLRITVKAWSARPDAERSRPIVVWRTFRGKTLVFL